MKRIVLLLWAAVLVAPLTFAQTTPPCGDQIYTDPNGCPAVIDMEKVAVHPESGKPLLLGWVSGVLGTEWVWAGYACDPEGLPLTFAATAGTLTVDPNDGNIYEVVGTIMQVGVTYVHISVTDMVAAEGQEVNVVTGTVGVIGLPKNEVPRLCAGRPQ